MELGYFTMPLHPPGSDITKTLEDDLDQIVTLDELGYKEAWIGEHFTFAYPGLFMAWLVICRTSAWFTPDDVLPRNDYIPLSVSFKGNIFAVCWEFGSGWQSSGVAKPSRHLL